MNILYHHRTQGKGVEGVHIRGIVNALRDLGHNVVVISPPGCDPIEEETTQSEAISSSFRTLFSFVSRSFPEFLFEVMELMYNIPTFFRINRELKLRRTDLIYERYFLFSISSILVSMKKSIPIIYEVNDSSFVPRLRPLKFVMIANALERKVLSMAHGLITVSDHFKKRLVENGIPHDKITVSHNAVDEEVFNPFNIRDVHLGLPTDHLVLGFLGSFVKWASPDKLIRVYHRIHSQFPETHLLLVGGGGEKETVKQMITVLGLQASVTIVEPVPHRDVPSYIARMDICIIPEHERYTSPVKLFEYMAMSKPVLAPACEGIGEVIEHGRNGMLFHPDREEHFFSVLKEMIENRELLAAIGANARRDVLERHSWRGNALQIVKNLERI